jgi:hypothetical protein
VLQSSKDHASTDIFDLFALFIAGEAQSDSLPCNAAETGEN